MPGGSSRSGQRGSAPVFPQAGPGKITASSGDQEAACSSRERNAQYSKNGEPAGSSACGSYTAPHSAATAAGYCERGPSSQVASAGCTTSSSLRCSASRRTGTCRATRRHCLAAAEECRARPVHSQRDRYVFAASAGPLAIFAPRISRRPHFARTIFCAGITTACCLSHASHFPCLGRFPPSTNIACC